MAQRIPFGVVGAISPWNAPLVLGIRSIAIPLAVGNTVVMKPSEDAPITCGLLLADVLTEAGLPAGVLNVVTNDLADAGDVVAALVADPRVRMVNFTGSTNVGRIIGVQAAQQLKPAVLELGGKNPLIILEDADPDLAVDAAVFGAFMLTGDGAIGGPNGTLIRPVVLTGVTADMDIFGSEIFGPATVIHPVDSAEAALDLANDTEYGLTGGVISRDLSAALDVVARVRSGIIHVNDQGIGDEPMAPFGGVKNTGYGRFGGMAGIESFTEQRWVTIQHSGRPSYPF
jgi:acyl-CoA reductase-like NAD-dependent aldehyde dehydrogenase